MLTFDTILQASKGKGRNIINCNISQQDTISQARVLCGNIGSWPDIKTARKLHLQVLTIKPDTKFSYIL